MTQLPRTQLLPGPASFGKGQSPAVGSLAQQAGFFESIDSLRAGWHFAGFMESIQRACILVAVFARGFLLHDVRPYVGGAR